MKYIALLLCVLVTSCVSIPTVQSPNTPREIYIEPITDETFESADTDNDGKLTQAEAKNLPKSPEQTGSGHVWAFVSIVGCVAAVCILAQVASRRKRTNTQ